MRPAPRYDSNDPKVFACRLAIELAGGPKKLADALNIKPPAVSQWDVVPAERCKQVSRLSGVPSHVLRPDVFEADVNAA